MFNANYVAYFDVVMTEWWREAIGPYHDLVARGVDMVVAEVNVRFLGPARFDDVLELDARLTRLGETAMSTRLDAAVDGSAVLEGHMRHVFIDAATKTKQQIPDDVRAALAPYLEGV